MLVCVFSHLPVVPSGGFHSCPRQWTSGGSVEVTDGPGYRKSRTHPIPINGDFAYGHFRLAVVDSAQLASLTSLVYDKVTSIASLRPPVPFVSRLKLEMN